MTHLFPVKGRNLFNLPAYCWFFYVYLIECVMNEQHRQILEFCIGGKKRCEIAQHFGLSNIYVYNTLRTLQRIGLIEKCKGKVTRGVAAAFITIGTVPELDKRYKQEYDPEVVNVEFIKRSHNIFSRVSS